MFISGGVSGFFLAQPSVDIMLHATYFVVGHFHMVMGVAAMFGIFAGTYFWFPKMFGKMMNEPLGKIHFLLTFIGVNLIFIPFHVMGMMGAPRRYSAHEGLHFLAGIQDFHKVITYVAMGTAAAQLIFLVNFCWSLAKGK